MSCIKELKDKGLRLTPQRRLIIDIISHVSSHLTSEEIINRVEREMPGVNKSTIYRTLDTLEQAGCLQKSMTGEGPIYHHADEAHHHHLVCSVCGREKELDEAELAPLKENLRQKHGFQADISHMVFFGRCKDCG